MRNVRLPFVVPLLLGLLVSLCGMAAQASQPLVLLPETSYFSIAQYVDVLEDHNGTLTIQDVSGAAHRDDFHPAFPQGNTRLHNDINFGHSASSYWLRLIVDSREALTHRMLFEVAFSSLDHVSFYTATAAGWQRLDAGDLVPFAERPVSHRNFVFPLMLSAGQQMLYLRVQSSGTLTIPLHLWEENDFDNYNHETYAVLAMYFGILLGLMLYNLLLYFSLRERVYLAYVGFVASLAVGLITLSGLGNQFLWPNWPAWGNAALPVGFAAAGAFGIQFTRLFLDTKKNTPRHDLVLQGLLAFFLLTLLACAALPYRWGLLPFLRWAQSRRLPLSAAASCVSAKAIPARVISCWRGRC